MKDTTCFICFCLTGLCLAAAIIVNIVVHTYSWWYTPELTQAQVFWATFRWSWYSWAGFLVFGAFTWLLSGKRS